MKRPSAAPLQRAEKKLRGSQEPPRKVHTAEWVLPKTSPLCAANHAMKKRTTNPASYRNIACCDLCGLPDLPDQGEEFYHCSVCKWDSCIRCACTLCKYVMNTTGDTIEVMQDMSATTSAHLGKRPKVYEWRVWMAPPFLSRHLEETYGRSSLSRAQRPVALELGAGSGLPSIVLAKTGAFRVVVTDQRQALPIARDTVRRNFPGIAGWEHTSSASKSRKSGAKGVPQCPAHCGELPTVPVSSLKEAAICGVCLKRPAGKYARSCSTCQFHVCSNCGKRAERSDPSLPAWFRVQCEGPPHVVGEAFSLDKKEAGADMMVWPLDWTSADDVVALREEAARQKLPPPSLILAADVAYEHELNEMLLTALTRIRDNWIRAVDPKMKSEVLFCNERRGHGVESALVKGFRSRGLGAPKRIGALEDSSGRVLELFKAAL